MEKGLPLPAHVASVMRSIGMAKVDAAKEYIEDVREPLVVFCTHMTVLQELRKQFPSAMTITGDDSRDDKNAAVEAFQGGKCDLIFCNVKAGGVGITLHRAKHMLFVEQYWSPAIMDQAMARIIRIGQKAKGVNITSIIAVNTIDEVMLDSLNYKRAFMKEVLDGQGSFTN